jgi:hypothetical protein
MKNGIEILAKNTSFGLPNMKIIYFPLRTTGHERSECFLKIFNLVCFNTFRTPKLGCHVKIKY